jgi:hypothetical protein
MSPISQSKKENNDLISDDYEKACLLNNYFCSISTFSLLKSGITDAVFHCVGNSDLESDILNKRERETQTVLHVFLSI